MDSVVLHAFGETVKTALGIGTVESYLAKRTAQGIGGASKLMRSPALRGATTSRQALGAMTGLERHSLGGVAAGGLATRRMEQAAANPVTQGMRQRVGRAWESAVTGQHGVRDPKAVLSHHYDYGATAMAMEHGGLSRPLGYTKAHVDQMMGPATINDPRGLMRAAPRPPVVQGGGTAVTRASKPVVGTSVTRPQIGGHGVNPTTGTAIAPGVTALAKRRPQVQL